MTRLLLIATLVLSGCQSKPTAAPTPASTPLSRERAINEASGEAQARLIVEDWLITARDEGGKELKAVRTWRILKVEPVEWTEYNQWDKKDFHYTGFTVRTLVDHSDDHGRPISEEVTFWLTHSFVRPADGVRSLSVAPAKIVRG